MHRGSCNLFREIHPEMYRYGKYKELTSLEPDPVLWYRLAVQVRLKGGLKSDDGNSAENEWSQAARDFLLSRRLLRDTGRAAFNGGSYAI